MRYPTAAHFSGTSQGQTTPKRANGKAHCGPADQGPSNNQFLSAVFGSAGAEGRIAFTSFAISPDLATGEHWGAKLAPHGKIPSSPSTSNNYFSTAVVRAERNRDNFIRLAVLVLDDIKGGAMPLAPSYRLETSARNFQYGYIIADSPESRDLDYAERAIKGLVAANLMVADKSGNNAVRWVRMLGSNTKAANIGADGTPFRCVLRELDRSRRYSIRQVLDAYGITVGAAPSAKLNGKAPHGADLATQFHTLMTGGPGMHDAQISVGMQLVRSGTNPAFAKNILRAVTCNDGTERMRARVADIDRTIDSAVEKIKTDQPSEPKRFNLLTVDELLAQPRMTWLIKGVLPRAVLIVVYGEAGSGKSAFAYDLIVSLVNGTPWCGRVVQQCRVVWVAAEGAGGHTNRTEAIDKARGLDRTRLLTLQDAPNLLDAEQVKELAKAITERGGADLIAVDTVAQVTPGANENASEDMGLLIANCRTLHDLTGATIMLIHHAGKDASKGARGWSGLRAAVDAELEISRTGDNRLARVTKMKDGVDNARFPFKLTVIPIGVDADGDIRTSIAIEHSRELPVIATPQPQGGIQKTVYTVLLEAQRTAADGRMAIQSLIDATVQYMVRDLKEEPETVGGKPKRDKRRFMVKRAIDKMADRGVVVVEYDYVCNRPVWTAWPVDLAVPMMS
jgi:AAA domain